MWEVCSDKGKHTHISNRGWFSSNRSRLFFHGEGWRHTGNVAPSSMPSLYVATTKVSSAPPGACLSYPVRRTSKERRVPLAALREMECCRKTGSTTVYATGVIRRTPQGSTELCRRTMSW